MEQNKLHNIAQKIASIATSIETKVFYFLGFAVFAASFLAWQWFDFNQFNFVFFIKAFLLIIPILCWFLFWLLLKQLIGLPEQVAELKNLGKNSINTIANIQQGTANRKSILSHLFQLITTLREPEILDTLLLCSKGIAWIINPLAWFVLLLSALFLFSYIFITIILLIF